MRQRLVLDLDEFKRVFGHVSAGRRHADDRLPLVGRGLLGEGIVRDGRRPGHRPQDPDGPASGRHLGGRDDLQDTVEFERRGGVDTHDAGVRIGRTAHRHVDRMRPVDVVGELPGAAEQTVVLLARHPGAEHRVSALNRRRPRFHVSHRLRSFLRKRGAPRRR